jgi:hypothetical protein
MTVPPQPDAGSTGQPSGAPPAGGGGGDAAWQAWAAALVDIVRALDDAASVTLTATPADARPVLLRPARLGGLLPARHEVVAPWVRLERSEDHLRGRCVGSESFGGPFPFSPEEDAALLALGWHRPGAGDGDTYVRFWPDDVPQGPFLPHAEAERAVAMVVATFRTVLLTDGGSAVPAVTQG